jgi:hypothetical protein
MHKVKQELESETTKAVGHAQDKASSKELPLWESPKLEDVSEQVMAQPYIRFT